MKKRQLIVKKKLKKDLKLFFGFKLTHFIKVFLKFI